jgi:GAF domain-containing protein
LPELERMLPVFAQGISSYFGFGLCAIVFVDQTGIRIAAVSPDSPVPPGMRLSGPMLFTTGVLASGSSLVLPDATSLSTSAGVDLAISKLGVRFMVAAPLLFQDVPVGALCLVDRDTHSFAAEDLHVVEGLGRDAASDLVRNLESIAANLGILPKSLFDRMLGAELSLLHRKKGGLDLVLLDVDSPAITSKLALEMVARGGSRFAVCRDSGRLAVFKRDSDASVATRAISASLQSLAPAAAVRAAGWVSIVDDGLPLLPSDAVLRLGALLLDQSQTDSGRRIKRMVVGGAAAPAGLFEPVVR